MSTIRLAVLHQAIEPPLIDGIRKAMKPGGYKDSSADIACVLRNASEIHPDLTPPLVIVTPSSGTDPLSDNGWSFPDTESGIAAAVHDHHATHIWTNTVLFNDHPLQMSKSLDNIADDLYVVGQPPLLVEKYDDKNWLNEMLKRDGRFTLPASWVVNLHDTTLVKNGLRSHLEQLNPPFPVIGKPIRGRGSHGVKLCHDLTALTEHLRVILDESPQIMIEEFLAGQEGTITVMPPARTTTTITTSSKSNSSHKYRALPFIERFNHHAGVAPYNGTVAVVHNSALVPLDVQAYPDHLGGDGGDDDDAAKASDNAYVDIRRQCELVAQALGCTAPIRIDVRRRRRAEPIHGKDDDDVVAAVSEEKTIQTAGMENPFVMFDINMKPNMTGPGRPGREDQSSLSAMAAKGLGWDYARLLREILDTARPLAELRKATLPEGWE